MTKHFSHGIILSNNKEAVGFSNKFKPSCKEQMGANSSPHFVIPVHGIALADGTRMIVTAIRGHNPEHISNRAVDLVGHAYGNPLLKMTGHPMGEVCPALQDFAKKGRDGKIEVKPECAPCADSGDTSCCGWAKQHNIRPARPAR